MSARAAILVCAALSCGCQSGLDELASLAPLDEPYFRCKVQPIVTKSCSQLVCHGDPNRYFLVFARNRLRLGGSEDERGATMRNSERAYNFESARAQVDRDAPAESWLLLKPLDTAAGGYYHGGATEYGRGDVYLTRDEPDFETLEEWVLGATAPADCIEPGSDQ